MLSHHTVTVALVLSLHTLSARVPAPMPHATPARQDPAAWWFCRAVGKRGITGDVVLLYADSASRVSRAFDRANTISHVFNAPGAVPEDVRAQFMAAARRDHPEVVNWRASCEGFATQDAAARADKASRARDRAAFPPSEWFALQGFSFRRG